jgi:hypothetical protein
MVLVRDAAAALGTGEKAGPSAMTEELRQDIQRRVHAVQRHYHDGGRAYRAAWIALAAVVIVVGLAMTVLPGPASIVIPVGLAMLAVRYRWAQWALRQTIDRGVRLQRRLAKASPAARIVSTLSALAVLSGIALVVLR